jgi:hypothetical protein
MWLPPQIALSFQLSHDLSGGLFGHPEGGRSAVLVKPLGRNTWKDVPVHEPQVLEPLGR